MIASLPPGQVLLRLVVLAGPVLAVLATGPAGDWPPWWLVAAVAVLGAGFAAVPDSSFGTAALLVPLVWWTLTLREGLQPEAVIAAAGLAAAHVAGLVAAYGPASMPVDPDTARLWLRRGLLVTLPVPVVYALAWLLRGDPEQPGIWVAGVAVATIAIVAASAMVRVRAGEDGG